MLDERMMWADDGGREPDTDTPPSRDSVSVEDVMTDEDRKELDQAHDAAIEDA